VRNGRSESGNRSQKRVTGTSAVQYLEKKPGEDMKSLPKRERRENRQNEREPAKKEVQEERGSLDFKLNGKGVD